MKFARQLEEHQLPEWSGQYLPYRLLKKRLLDIASGHGATTVAELLRSSSPAGDRRSWPQTPARSLSPSGSSTNVGSSISMLGSAGATSSAGSKRRVALGINFLTATPGSDTVDEDAATPSEVWQRALEIEAKRIGACVNRGLEELQVQFRDLDAMAGMESSAGPSPVASSQWLQLRVLDALGRVAEGLARLRGFAELNHAALYKILKKHDKVLGIDTGLGTLYAVLVQDTRLGDMSRFDDLDAKIRAASLQNSGCCGLEASPEVARIAAGLGSSHLAAGFGRDRAVRRRERLLFFFLGSSSALFVAIFVLILLPEKDPETFFTSYFLSSFVVFRVIFSIMLLFWGIGTVAHVCEESFINYAFILGIDPRCTVGPSFLFGRAAMLTSLWILVFGMYIVDYKWMVLPVVMSSTGFNSRSSLHYVIYPCVLLGLTLLLLVSPSRICRFRYRTQVLQGVVRTAIAPWCPVTFGDNVVGDVLTSLAKPLQDIPAACCFIFSHHPQQTESIDKFVKHGNSCPAWEHRWILPLIGGAPFWFRLLQCARRYRDTGETKHLLNMGKYAASLLVVFVALDMKHHWSVVVATSLVATIYAATWDILMDWGLGLEELDLCRRRRRCGHSGQITGVAVSGDVSGAGAGAAVSGDAAGVPAGAPRSAGRLITGQELGDQGADPSASIYLSSDSLSASVAAPSGCREAPRTPARALQASTPATDQSGTAASVTVGPQATEKRHFSPLAYRLAVVLDILARMTWVLTLMPINLLSDDIVQRAVLHASISAVEIWRRSLWVVLRIEYEQVANASGYRALLWVPRRMNRGDSHWEDEMLEMKADVEPLETGPQRPARQPLLRV